MWGVSGCPLLKAVIAQVTSSPSSSSSSSSSGGGGGGGGGGEDGGFEGGDAVSVAGSDAGGSVFGCGSEFGSEGGMMGGVGGGDTSAAWMLQVSFGRLQWTPCKVRLHDGKLEVFASSSTSAGGARAGLGGVIEKQLAAPLKLASGGALRLPKSAAAGQRHALVACPDESATDVAMDAVKAAAAAAAASSASDGGGGKATATATSHLPGLVRTSRRERESPITPHILSLNSSVSSLTTNV